MKYRYTLIVLLSTMTLFSQEHSMTIFDTIGIDEIVVTQSIPLSEDNRLNQAQTANLISIDEINARLAQMSLINRGAYAKEPLINNFAAGQINVTIDGMKMFGACTDKMDPVTSYVEPANLSQVDLSQGSNGSEFGSTIGGTYNMILEKPALNELSAAGSVIYDGISNGKTSHTTINWGKKYWAYRVNGVVKDFQSYRDGNNNTVSFTQYRKLNLYQNLLLAPNNNYNLAFDWLVDDAYNVGYHALPMDVSKAQGRIYSLTYNSKRSFASINNVKAKIYTNSVYHVMDDSQRDSLYFVENYRTGKTDSVYMKMDMPGWSNTYGGFIQGYSLLGEKSTLFFKLENYYNWSKAEMTMYMNNLSNPGEPPMFAETWPEHERNVIGFYVKNTTQLYTNMSISADVRIDFAHSQILSEQGKNQFLIFTATPGKKYQKTVKTVNLNVFWQPANTIKITTGTGYGERLPTLSEQFGFYLFNALDGYDYIGNPGLKTEKSFNAWYKIDYMNPKFKYTFEANASLVNNYILGTISPEYQALNLYASGTKRYSNINEVILLSTNFQLLWKPINHLELFSITKFNFGQINNHQPLPLIAPIKSMLNLTWEKNNWYLQAEGEYSATQNRINQDFGETPSSSFILLHCRSTYKFDLQQFKLRIMLGMENIMNTVYSEHLDWGDYYRPGRNIRLGLQLNY
ncbi:MAG: hypothetical protein MI922_23450 [Bacteroidales bacterium]|nr:hypothetical protein [Bacteroidales bacterium]